MAPLSTDPKTLKVPELKAALAALNEPTEGKKAELVARLEKAQAPASGSKRSTTVDLTKDSPPPAAKKGKGKAAAKPKWFWAEDDAAGVRRWAAYPAAAVKLLEKALAAGEARCEVSKEHYVDLSTPAYSQHRADNSKRSRPVERTADGAPPAKPPAKPPASAHPAKSAAAPPPKPAAKSITHGGVQQVRYSAGSSTAGDAGAVKKQVVKGRAAVDASAPNAGAFHVYEEGGDVYDALLNQTDIATNKNKYYIIQLLESDKGGDFRCWNRWGRVGEERNLQNALRGPMDLASAKADFEGKFRDKTKNPWANRAAFSPVQGKYTLIERDYGEAEAAAPAPAAQPAGAPKKAVVSKLDPRVQTFIKLVADLKMMETAMREIGFDPNKMPLGKLKKATVMKGYEILQELSQLVVSAGAVALSGPAAGSSSAGVKSLGHLPASASTADKVMALSNAFYTVIPHTSEGKRGTRTALPPINSAPLLKSKVQMVEALANIEIASRVIDTKGAGFETHPVDAKYAQLKTRLTPIDTSSATHAMLDAYLQNTHAKTHNTYQIVLTQAFEVEREGEKEAFKDVGNRMLLWHGSRLTNWVGILSGGLRIAPPEAPVTGYMFGKGVYFADMSSKSANYCFASQGAPDGVMLLCDVALGKQYERTAHEYNAGDSCKAKGAHSTFGKGRTAPAPSGTTTLPGSPKVRVPMGLGAAASVSNSSLLYNEFIVYDTAL